MALLSNEERESQVLLSRELGPIFPLYGVIELAPGRLVCECGKLDCRNAGKHPRWRNFQKRASLDPNRIRDWFDEFPHANYGVLTGIAAIAIDVDVRPDSNGLLTLDYLQIDHGRRIPYTVEVLTGRGNGSRHLYFSPDATVRTRAKVLPGLDVRAAGGYCVAAGSRHFYGGYYHFPEEYSPEEQDIAELPNFLLSALAETASKPVILASETLSSKSPAAFNIPASPKGTVLPDRIVLGVMMRDPVARYFWNGGRRNQTPSEDDFALACKLAFYCRHDLQQMYRLFMQSGLRRSKFEEQRPGGNYAFWTLKRAIQFTPHTWIRKERRIPGARRGRRPASRKAWEKRIVGLIMTAIDERQSGEKPLSPISINVYLRVVNTFLRWLRVEDEYLQFAWKVKELETPSGDRREIFSDEDVAALQKYKPTSFSQIRAWTIAMLMLDCGVRIEEALSLTVADIDYDGDILKIVGKGNKSRAVPISLIKPILNKFITKHMPPKAKYVFGTASGKMMSQRNALRDLQVVQRAAKMTLHSWHSFRHTFASGFLRRGGKIDKLQRILGHADIRTTGIYLHLENEYLTDEHEAHSSLTPI